MMTDNKLVNLMYDEILKSEGNVDNLRLRYCKNKITNFLYVERVPPDLSLKAESIKCFYGLEADEIYNTLTGNDDD